MFRVLASISINTCSTAYAIRSGREQDQLQKKLNKGGASIRGHRRPLCDSVAATDRPNWIWGDRGHLGLSEAFAAMDIGVPCGVEPGHRSWNYFGSWNYFEKNNESSQGVVVEWPHAHMRGQVATQIAIPAQLDNPVAPPHRRPIRNVEADELGEEPVGDTLPHLHNLMND
ncbi:hypothetical protein ONZ51_g3617 [Trametes cubensis]|uniref:Uncharacterized protein n=1 Tax=Trametes cubensis TaxID=1111947 RepID=A0AAD7XCU6_9APHY|nr:hypothetical protein ONZ51_g3617 [Trametes cubensis]